MRGDLVLPIERVDLPAAIEPERERGRGRLAAARNVVVIGTAREKGNEKCKQIGEDLPRIETRLHISSICSWAREIVSMSPMNGRRRAAKALRNDA
ncbi:hypothetical protein Y034_6097 [Burkholderia pseudomallei MSHR449]|nr:hypothetical protein DO63_5796 [Burkholderia pseudomallei]KGW98962.1 hypothetical protein Y034_6097 [Burkholderia pseudomallei MSHR449]